MTKQTAKTPPPQTKVAATPLFNRALKIAERAAISTDEIKRKLLRLIIVFILGLGCSVAVGTAIRTGLPQSEAAKAFAALGLLMSLVVTVAAVFGGFRLLWTVYLIAYFRELENYTAWMEKVIDQPVSDNPQPSDKPMLDERPRRLWATTVAALVPSIPTIGFVLVFYLAFGHDVHEGVARYFIYILYFLTTIHLATAAYVGVMSYRTNQEFWEHRPERRAFKLTFLRSNRYLDSVFTGLFLAAVLSVAGAYVLDAQRATSAYRDVSLAYAREYLEKVALQSIKERQSGGQFIQPTTEQKEIQINTTPQPANRGIRYQARPNGLDDSFIAVVTDDAGELYLVQENGNPVPDSKFKTQFVVGIVKDVSDDKFLVDVGPPGQGEDDIEVKLTELVSKPTSGDRVAVAMNLEDRSARKIEILEPAKSEQQQQPGNATSTSRISSSVFDMQAVKLDIKSQPKPIIFVKFASSLTARNK